MDDDRDRLDMDPVSEFNTTVSSSGWTLPGAADAHDSVDNVYFFGSNSDRILSEFGWNLPPPPAATHAFKEPGGSCSARGGYGELDRIIDSDLAGNCDKTSIVPESTTSTFATTAATTSSGGYGGGGGCGGEMDAEQQPVASSSSSEDQPEKSTASGGSASKPTTTETA